MFEWDWSVRWKLEKLFFQHNLFAMFILSTAPLTALGESVTREMDPLINPSSRKVARPREGWRWFRGCKSNIIAATNERWWRVGASLDPISRRRSYLDATLFIHGAPMSSDEVLPNTCIIEIEILNDHCREAVDHLRQSERIPSRLHGGIPEPSCYVVTLCERLLCVIITTCVGRQRQKKKKTNRISRTETH